MSLFNRIRWRNAVQTAMPGLSPVEDQSSGTNVSIGSIIDSIVNAIIPAPSQPVITSDYKQPEPVQPVSYQAVYNPPLPILVDDANLPATHPLEPVSYPTVEYTDPALTNAGGTIQQSAVAEKAPVTGVLDTITSLIQSVSSNKTSGAQDKTFIYVALGVAGIGILALLFKK